MTFVIRATPIAANSVALLRGEARDAYDAKLLDLKAAGCQVCGYRLTGELFERICCVHLWGSHRLLACFPNANEIIVLIVGKHDDSDRDVYRILLRLLELPDLEEIRTKPPCCDAEGKPPVADELVDRLESASRKVVRDLRRRL